MRGIEAQFLALQKGFSELIPQHLLKPFDHKELEVRVWYVNNILVLIKYLYDFIYFISACWIGSLD